MKRKSQEQSDRPNQSQKAKLIEEIFQMRESYFAMEKRIGEIQHRCHKMVDSNMRNQKRLLRYRARIEEMNRFKDSPQHFLAVSGHMNESIQEFILSQNYTFSADPQQLPDPDHMTYEQLLQLGDRIGKVSKGLSKQQIERLNHKHNKKADQRCPICQNEMEISQVVIELPCLHTYHEECILFWLKDENTCPICKCYLSDGMKSEEKNGL